MDAYSSSPNSSAKAPTPGMATRLGVRFGAGAGLLCALWMAGLQLSGNNGFGPKQLLAQLLVPLVAVASQWKLRRGRWPERPGLGRSLGVGGLTVLTAALLSAAGLVAVARGAGEPALARHRAEVLEIVRAQQRENPKAVVSAAQRQQQVQTVERLTIGEMAVRNFIQVLLLGLVLALPAGIFLRE